MKKQTQQVYGCVADSRAPIKLRPIAKRAVIILLALTMWASLFPVNASACTGVYAGGGTTENGSIYLGRSEDFGPDWVKQFVIVPAADHAPDEMLEDDYGFCVPYPAHTLRYSAVMDDPAEYSGRTVIPFGEAGINEKGVAVSATVSTYFNEKVQAVDPLTSGGLTEMSMASYILQSAGSAEDAVLLLADCIDRYGHGSTEPDDPDYREVSTVLIADHEETWVFEIVSGHQYVATRLSHDTVSLLPNDIMTQQVNVSDRNVIASPGLISTAKDGGFYVTDIEGADEINVAKSYSQGYSQYSSYRFYYGANILNRELAEGLDVVPKPIAKISDQFPNASVEEAAVGPFSLEYQPSEAIRGRISLMTLRQVLASHGEGTAYETTSKNENSDGVPMRSIGTYRQNEEHIFEIRRDRTIPVSVSTIEWLAMGPSEFSVYVPFYAAAMTETPDAYTTESTQKFDSESIYWLFNEIGNAGNGSYYRMDGSGAYYDRNGDAVDGETARAVLQFLSDSEVINGLHDSMNRAQDELNAKAAGDDEMMVALARSASDEEVAARANQLANENAEYVKRIASEKLTEIDNEVSAFIKESNPGQDDNHRPGETKIPVVLFFAVLLLLVCSVIGYHIVKRKKTKRVC
ncbi:MAG: C69 family dipeptidase [Clostridia bacterium]|nr:C69 family dipeptidase [Clostridia bacterium]